LDILDRGEGDYTNFIFSFFRRYRQSQTDHHTHLASIPYIVHTQQLAIYGGGGSCKNESRRPTFLRSTGRRHLSPTNVRIQRVLVKCETRAVGRRVMATYCKIYTTVDDVPVELGGRDKAGGSRFRRVRFFAIFLTRPATCMSVTVDQTIRKRPTRKNVFAVLCFPPPNCVVRLTENQFT